jgi:transcriptional regulator with XRE-family HTH domain
MIRNEREYRITKTQTEKFQAAIDNAKGTKPPPGVHPKLHQASIEGMIAQRATLLEELGAYEELQASGGKRFRGEFRDLPTVLIQARIARSWSQRELGEKLGLHTQKIQQYEAGGYAVASVTRIADVAAALGLQLELRGQLVDLPADLSSLAAAATPARPQRRARAATRPRRRRVPG